MFHFNLVVELVPCIADYFSFLITTVSRPQVRHHPLFVVVTTWVGFCDCLLFKVASTFDAALGVIDKVVCDSFSPNGAEPTRLLQRECEVKES